VSTSPGALLRPSAEDAAAAWRSLVGAAREQRQRLWREVEGEREGFLRSRLGSFRPGATASEELEHVLSLARSDDAWMDIGAGAGRLTVPLAGVVRRVVAVEPSPTMREALGAAIAEAGVVSIELHDRRWPEDADALPVVDVALSANFLYGLDEPLPFLEAMERRSRRLCVVALADRSSRVPNLEVWEEVVGEPYVAGPGAAELVVLLLATGRRADVRWFQAAPPRALPPDQAVEQQRWRLGLRPDSPRLDALRAAVERRIDADGLVRLRSGRSCTAVLSWEAGPAG
jgi:hypothetical protein